MSERKGAVAVRSGKGNKYRVVPLNADVRRALGQYLTVGSRRSSPKYSPCAREQPNPVKAEHIEGVGNLPQRGVYRR
jgi:hypothetical protein